MLLALACAGTTNASHQRHLADTREVMTAEELTRSGTTDLAEAIRLLRPTWLRGRGPQSIRASVSSLPIVYVDGIRAGNNEWLRNIPTASVAEVRFISAADATTRWGTGHASGVILVLTRR